MLYRFVLWGVGNPLYGFGVLVGFALGIFYGFDGWRGATDDLELKDSPRTKNLVWLLTAALATVVGDVKAVDSTAQKPLLLFAYCAAVLAGAVIVVFGWGVFVLVDSVLARRNLGYQYSPFDALGDYFYFGYRKYRERKQALIADRRKNLDSDYLTQIAYSITMAGSEISPSQRLAAARNILRSITAVVKQYRGDHASAKIRTNLMVVRTCTSELRSQMSFVSPGESVERCLVLVAYDDDQEHRKLVLPIATKPECALPGAPAAFVEETPVILDDTRSMMFPTGIAAELQKDIQAYFSAKQTAFKSFASLRVIGSGEAIAVVNLDCSETNIFGSEEADKVRIVEYLFPFCAALGVLLKAGLE